MAAVTWRIRLCLLPDTSGALFTYLKEPHKLWRDQLISSHVRLLTRGLLLSQPFCGSPVDGVIDGKLGGLVSFGST